MKKITALLLLSLSILSAQAAEDCDARASQKKLAGAAKTSFLKKCNADAQASAQGNAACESKAKQKKLAGAAKNSFVKKCVADANLGEAGK